MTNNTAYRRNEQGATALVIVMFAVLLFVTVTVGFMKIMSLEQSRSNDNELSQGAYDSALAGVEDGKRVLAACAADSASDACTVLAASPVCTTISDAKIVQAQANGEVYLKTSSGANGTDFQQSYTCVKISRNTKDYKGTLKLDESNVVPLSVASTDSFDTIHFYWYAKDPASPLKKPALSSVANPSLPKLVDWDSSGSNANPPIMRLQLMQFSASSFKQADFDGNGASHTLYLYPNQSGVTALDFASDGRRVGTLAPTLVKCANDFVNDGYACEATIKVPDTIGMGGDMRNRRAYLRVTTIYSAADYKIKLEKSGVVVDFNGVQPSIDSTGRAADVFRRVDARVELVDPNESLLYPRATVDITHNFCKTFIVALDPADYSAGSCDPTKP